MNGLAYPVINPVAVDLGFFQIHWYGLMYLFGIGGAWLLARYRAKYNGFLSNELISDLVFYVALGVVLGGRIGYVIFYHPEWLWQDPLLLIAVWEGGMSFHGGLIGVGVAIFLFSRKAQKSFLSVLDFTVPFVPLGLGLGRIGNFINSELPGRVTDSAIGFVNPLWGELPRHASSLYQAFTEGLLLFILVWCFSRRTRPEGAVTGVFLIAYSCFRITTEFFREPDGHLGFVFLQQLTMGQMLSIPMILVGIFLLWRAYRISA